MFEKKVVKKTFSTLVAIMLLTSTVSFAFAQSGDQGTGSNQQDTGTGQQDQFQQGQQSQDQQGQGQQDQFQQGQNQQNQGQQGVETGQNNMALTCSQTYVVQQGDSLSGIANQFYGDPQGFNTILQATNNAVKTDSNFTNINDANLIEPGQTLCIPASADTSTTGMADTGAGQQGQFQQGQAQQAPAGTGDQMLDLPQGQGLLVVENQAGGDIIFDVNQPGAASSAWVGPDEQEQFTLPAGNYDYNAHHPLGDFSITPSKVQVMPGQVIRLACSTNMCQPVPQQQGQQGQFQQGPQGQSQQGQQNQFQQGGQQQQELQNNDSTNNGAN